MRRQVNNLYAANGASRRSGLSLLDIDRYSPGPRITCVARTTVLRGELTPALLAALIPPIPLLLGAALIQRRR